MQYSTFKRGLGAVALGTLMLGALGAPAKAEIDKIRWPVPMSFASNLTALGDTMPWVAEHVKALSDGQIDLRIFEPGKLVPALGIFEGVSQGKIEAGYSWMGYEIGQVPASALFGAMPFGLEPAQYVAWYYYAGGKELVEETFEPYNVHPIFCGTISPEAAGWSNKEIKTADDIKGLKWRAAGLGGKVWQKMGASVTLLPGGELFQALEKGVLDGTEFSLPTVDAQLGFNQVAKYYYLPGWHQPSTSQYLYVQKGKWDELSDQSKAIIEGACTAGVTMAIAKSEALQGPQLNKFQEGGTVAEQFSPELLTAFEDATKEVLQEEAGKDEMFKKVYESQIAFKEGNASWNRLGYLPRDFDAIPAAN